MFYIHLVVIVICSSTILGLDEGDSCTLLSSGKQAECKSIQKCPSALQLIQKLQFPQTCGFAGTVPIVCCTDFSGNSDPTTTARPEITSGTQRTTKPTASNASNVNPFAPNSVGYRSFEKCIEYSNQAKSYQQSPTLIIGGAVAMAAEFPHMVLVGYNSSDGMKWLCGGSLISESYVLTAAHCLWSREYGDAVYTRLGITETDDSNYRQDIPIIERIRHPNYRPPSYYNDIGLLKLQRAATFDNHVIPVCLNYNPNSNKKAILSGWGKTSPQGPTSDKLMKVTLHLNDTALCNKVFIGVGQLRLKNGIDEATQICAGFPGKDACDGDSGGPLQIYSKTQYMYEVLGVVSFGKTGCASHGVYTRVSYYVEWIEKTIWG